MYSTCLFCTRHMGQNEALENCQVGRRLAYDPVKARLWVVCPHCERWNLSPLDTRLEAIDEAERLYRATPLRVATDNVGLAQLREGLELVRLGAPARPELAAWRYGDQFGRRRRQHLVVGGVVVGGALLPMAIPLMMPFTGLAVAAIGATFVLKGGAVFKVWRDTTHVSLHVRDDQNRVLPLTYRNARCAALVPSGGDDWQLKVFYRVKDNPGPEPRAMLAGETAHRALATMLPHLNRGGGNKQHVQDATEVIRSAPNLAQLLRTATVSDEARTAHYKIRNGESNVAVLAPRLRLALEMVLHEDDERRAMEGELDKLEARWREAEEIAAIADSLILPSAIETEMDELRRRAGRTG